MAPDTLPSKICWTKFTRTILKTLKTKGYLRDMPMLKLNGDSISDLNVQMKSKAGIVKLTVWKQLRTLLTTFNLKWLMKKCPKLICNSAIKDQILKALCVHIVRSASAWHYILLSQKKNKPNRRKRNFNLYSCLTDQALCKGQASRQQRKL